jgi:hypothetical protein
MDDFIKGVKAQLYERATSPLLFSFLLSWAVWNYRAILIAVSSLPAPDKLLALDLLPLQAERFGLTFEAYWPIWGFVGPLVTSLLYIFIYPIPARWIFEHTRKEQKRLKELQTQIDDDTPMTHAEARKLRDDLRRAEGHIGKLMKEHDEEVERLRLTIDELESRAAQSPPPKTEEVDAVLDDAQLQILSTIVKSTHTVNQDENLKSIDDADLRVRIHHAIDELVRLKYVNRTPNKSLYATEKGRAYVVASMQQETRST